MKIKYSTLNITIIITEFINNYYKVYFQCNSRSRVTTAASAWWLKVAAVSSTSAPPRTASYTETCSSDSHPPYLVIYIPTAISLYSRNQE